MSEQPTIRPFVVSDRSAVRQIACDTADCGRPVERFFPDREIFADLLTRYYTDFEPESSWVGVDGLQVVGYLNGCMDSHRHERVMRRRIGPALLLRALRRGVFLRPAAIRFMALNISLWISRGRSEPVDYAEFPAHLHVNLRPGFRGHGLGRMLVETFVSHARSRKVRGIHASVREDNEKARAFFERLGFLELGRNPVVRLDRGAALCGEVYWMRLGV